MQLVLLQYNNYLNRELKKEDDVRAYYASATKYQVILDYDFNPGDGVDTTAVLGGDDADVGDNFDYLIVVEDGEIVSRWFILESDRSRLGQYIATLRRDSVADNFSAIKRAPMLIEKATLADDDILTYTDEPMPLNQIKTTEALLKDETGIAWILGYVDRNMPDDTSITFKSDVVADFTTNNIQNFKYGNGKDFYFKVSNHAVIRIREDITETHAGMQNISTVYYVMDFNRPIKRFRAQVTSPYDSTLYNRANWKYTLPVWQNASAHKDDVLDRLGNYEFTEEMLYDFVNPIIGKKWLPNEQRAEIQSANGKIVYDTSTNKYYRIHVNSQNAQTEVKGIGYDVEEFPASGYVREAMEDSGDSRVLMSNGGDFRLGCVIYTTTLEEIAKSSFGLTFPKVEKRMSLKDAPYDMFCIPMPINQNATIKNSKVTAYASPVRLSESMALQTAQGIAEELGNHLIDIQIVPYCPVTLSVSFTDGVYKLDINDDTSYVADSYSRFTPIVNEGTVVNYLIWALASSGSKAIIPAEPIEVDNVKMENQTTTYRLCSGSYASTFEFNAAKNGGVDYFDIDYTYIPYNPYIHVAPNFKNLYGEDFEDCRGLIDQGDKSISYMSDAWVQYQINNKTYAQQFDRQIQNMDVNHKYDRVSQIAGAAGSAIATGIGVGALTNPAVGIAAGTASALAGGIDVAMNEQRFAEQKSYAIDAHNFGIQNIKALPQSIAKLTAYSRNNKVFPVLEKYDCTRREKDLFAHYIRYNGMTVNAIGTIEDFLDNRWKYNGIEDKGFIKGQIIQLTDLGEDYHMASTIYNELVKGIYTR